MRSTTLNPPINLQRNNNLILKRTEFNFLKSIQFPLPNLSIHLHWLIHPPIPLLDLPTNLYCPIHPPILTGKPLGSCIWMKCFSLAKWVDVIAMRSTMGMTCSWSLNGYSSASHKWAWIGERGGMARLGFPFTGIFLYYRTGKTYHWRFIIPHTKNKCIKNNKK